MCKYYKLFIYLTQYITIIHTQMQQEDLTPITDNFLLNKKKQLGQGCFGKVYEGYDTIKKRKIAIKHMNKPQNFHDEVETLQKLSSLVHPNIVGFYGFKEIGDDVYLFVEYCPGGVLTSLIQKGLTQEETLDLFREIVQGMCYMNAKGILHRDLKPDNILIGTRGNIKISDFGLAKQYSLDLSVQCGTPLYAGPEVYTNFFHDSQNYNQKCDVWSAGLILHEMLTGKHPFNEMNKMNMENLKKMWNSYQKGQTSIKYGPDFHPQWEYITNIMLTHNFKKRPTFHDILEILKKIDDRGNMRQEIKNIKMGLKIHNNSRQSLVQCYLDFIDQKADLLVRLEEELLSKNYNYINSCLKYLLIFLAASRYVSWTKKIVRNLKFKTLKFPNGQDFLETGKPDNNVVLTIEKYRNIFQTKSTKYKNYLKEQIIPKICSAASSSENDKNMLKSLDSAYKLVLEMKDGGMDIQQNYAEEYFKVLGFYKTKPTEQKLENMDIKDREIYLRILILGFLDQQFSDKNFEETNYVKNKLQKLSAANPQQLTQTIVRLRKQLN